MDSRALRVFLVEDHPAVCEGLSLLLRQKGIFVAGCAATVDGALEALCSQTFDAAIVDLSLEGGSGLALPDALAARDRLVPLVVYSMHEEQATIREALDRGARGYVTKRDPVDSLLAAVLAVVRGEQYLSPRAASCLAGGPKTDQLEQLPPRERRIYDLIGDGFGASEIAAELSLSVRTIETYCTRIQDRLGLMGMRELRRHAISTRRAGG
jgi:DNA-binding NarL/FixJ family response regulator